MPSPDPAPSKMADYYSLLSRTVTQLDRADNAGRLALYQRARNAQLRQLRSAPPALSDAEITAQIEALEAAIARLEDEFARERCVPRWRKAAPSPDEFALAPIRTAARASAAFVPGRRWIKTVLGGVAAAVITIGAGFYYLILRSGNDPPSSSERAVAAAPSSPQAVAEGSATSATSYVLRRQRVFHRTTHPAGTIIISRIQRFLYLVQPNQVAIRYAIGIGPECEMVVGLFRIREKTDNPGWDHARAGGAKIASGSAADSVRAGPFGPRALYFGPGHAVHGTSEPESVGRTASFGCFHSWNDDVVELYDRVILNERVVVAN